MAGGLRDMKVLVSAYSVSRADVSEAHLVYEFIRRAAAHVSLTVVSTGSRRGDGCGLESVLGVHNVRVLESVHWQRWPGLDRSIHPGMAEFGSRSLALAREAHRESAFDVCHQLTPFAPRYSSALRRLGVPLVMGPLMGGLGVPKGFESLVRREPWYHRLRCVDRLRLRLDPAMVDTYERASLILLGFEYLRPLIPKRWHAKVRILSPIGVDTQVFALLDCERRAGPLRLLYVGRIVPYKGLLWLVEALSTARVSENVRLVVVGDGPDRKLCQARARELGVASRIEWVGRVAHDEVRRFFQDCDLFCLPALTEAGGIVVLEAMAMGKPVLCLDRGGPGEIVNGSCGIKVRVCGPEQIVRDMAEAIDWCVDNRCALAEMGREGRRRAVTVYDWDILARRLVAFYQEAALEE